MTGGFFFRIIEDRRREREILLEREETEIFGNGGIRLNANARDQRATAIARHESNRANPSTREQASISIKVYIYIHIYASAPSERDRYTIGSFDFSRSYLSYRSEFCLDPRLDSLFFILSPVSHRVHTRDGAIER